MKEISTQTHCLCFRLACLFEIPPTEYDEDNPVALIPYLKKLIAEIEEES